MPLALPLLDSCALLSSLVSPRCGLWIRLHLLWFCVLQHGYRHIDTAKDYGNEEEIGKALKEALQENGMKREDVWVTTKLL